MDITQNQLAIAVSEFLGIKFHKSAISKIESGIRPLSLEEAVAISEALLLPLPDLVEGILPTKDGDLFEIIRKRFGSIGKLVEQLLLEYDRQEVSLLDFQERIERRNPLPRQDWDEIEELKEVVALMLKHTKSMTKLLEWRLYADTSFSKIQPLYSLEFTQFANDDAKESFDDFAKLIEELPEYGR